MPTSNESFILGNQFANSGDHKMALKMFTDVLASNPNNATAWNNSGVAKLCMGEWESALNDFKKAINLDPE